MRRGKRSHATRAKASLRAASAIVIEGLETRQMLSGGEPLITEFLANHSTLEDWIEVYNPGPSAVNLNGWRLTDDVNDLDKWTFPSTPLTVGAFVSVTADDTQTAPVPGQPLHANFRLSADGEYLALVRPDGTVAHEFAPKYPGQIANVSYGVGPWSSVNNELLVTSGLNGLPGKVLVPTAANELPANWKDEVLDDSAFTIEGPSGIGYDTTSGGASYDAVINTPIEDEMFGENASAFIRVPFELNHPNDFTTLTLKMRYDDGFAAYINGTLVASRNSPGTLEWNSTATGTINKNTTFEDINISQFRHLLHEGDNVLAIHALNDSNASDDMLIVPQLVGNRVVFGGLQYMTTPTKGAINNAGAVGQVADTEFSHDRGFYDAPFALTIKSDTPSAQIRYTLDGSLPTETTGTLYTGPIQITGTKIVRAIAYRPGYISSNVDAQTYIFLDQVMQQTGDGLPAFSSWGHAGPDWEMDPNIVNDPNYGSQLEDALRSISSVSVSMPWDELFGLSGTRIYQSNNNRVPQKVSVEMLHPDGTRGFHATSQMQVQGGSSDISWRNDKLSLELTFKEQYGPSTLDYPVFGEGATDRYDKLVLDAVFNQAWTYNGGSAPDNQRGDAKFIVDQYMADLQNATGGSAPHARFVHLYLNGLYWGMYYLHEKPTDRFAADYNGGSKDDYDIMKHNQSQVVSGSNANYLDLVNRISTFSGNPTQANYDSVLAKLDVEEFIDYMIVNFYGGNTDWAHQNWYASFNRVDPNGRWRFHSWDAEHSLHNGSDAIPGAQNTNVVGKNDGASSPTGFHTALRASPEYRMLFADRVQKHFFNGGVMSPTEAADIYQKLIDEVNAALVAESARWGDNIYPDVPYHRDHWRADQDSLLVNYFPVRTSNVLGQLRSGGSTNIPAAAATITSGTQANGTVANTGTNDSQRHVITAAGATPSALIDLFYEYTVSTGIVPASAFVNGHLGETNMPGGDTIALQVFNWTTSNWVTLNNAVFTGQSSTTTDVTTTLTLGDAAYVGSGVNANKVRMRFFSSSLETGTQLRVDQLTLTYSTSVVPLNTNAPLISTFGGTFPGATSVTLSKPTAPGGGTQNGNIYYTLNGQDPRLPGGALNPAAILYTSGNINISTSARLKARILNGGEWSALIDPVFVIGPAPAIRVGEIMYNPAQPPVGSAFFKDDFEYLELINTGGSNINLSGITFEKGITFTFSGGTLAPGARAVIVKNVAAFQSRYGNLIPIAGTYTGELNNGGERLEMRTDFGQIISTFTYNDNWFDHTDGGGWSLVARDPAASDLVLSSKAGWRPSTPINGGPGASDAGINPGAVVINETSPNSANPQQNWIELRNTTGAPIDITAWFLSNAANALTKWVIPATVIPVNGFVTFSQAQFGAAFGLSVTGDELFLSGIDGAGNLGGYRDTADYGAIEQGGTFGRHIKSTTESDFARLGAATPGAANAYPIVGPVVITEIMHNPLVGSDEYIEIRNVTGQSQNLDGLGFTSGVSFSFAAGATLAPGAHALIVGIDPLEFRLKYSIAAAVQIFGPYVGSLNNAGEKLAISKLIGSGVAIELDRVSYDNDAPWPLDTSATGKSLARSFANLYPNDVANWKSETGGSAGAVNTGAPYVFFTPLFSYGTGPQIKWQFSENVTPNAHSITVKNLDANTDLPFGGMTFDYDPVTGVAMLTLPADLADANYRITLNPAGFVDGSSNQLDGDYNGTPGGALAYDFFHLMGDVDRNRKVDHVDFNALYAAFGTSGGGWAGADLNLNGKTDFADFQIMERGFGNTLAVPAAPATAPAATPVVKKPVAIKPTKPVATKKPVPVKKPATTPAFSMTKISKRKNDLLA